MRILFLWVGWRGVIRSYGIHALRWVSMENGSEIFMYLIHRRPRFIYSHQAYGFRLNKVILPYFVSKGWVTSSSLKPTELLVDGSMGGSVQVEGRRCQLVWQGHGRGPCQTSWGAQPLEFGQWNVMKGFNQIWEISGYLLVSTWPNWFMKMLS